LSSVVSLQNKVLQADTAAILNVVCISEECSVLNFDWFRMCYVVCCST